MQRGVSEKLLFLSRSSEKIMPNHSSLKNPSGSFKDKALSERKISNPPSPRQKDDSPRPKDVQMNNRVGWIGMLGGYLPATDDYISDSATESLSSSRSSPVTNKLLAL